MLPTLLWLPLGGLWLGCPAPDDIILPAPTPDTPALLRLGDDDGDGYKPSEGDCDNGDEDVNPGSAEACDGIDNNCDGEVDEDCP